MIKSVLVAVSTAALIATAGGVAFADDPPADASLSCEEALARFNDVRALHLAALDADEAAADARDDDSVLADAVADVVDHPETIGNDVTVADAEKSLLAARTALIAAGVANNDVLSASQLQLLGLIDDALVAESIADDDDAAALQAEADKTDARALEDDREAARLDAERICNSDVVDEDPVVVDEDDDDDVQVDVYPDEAPNTGGGPA